MSAPRTFLLTLLALAGAGPLPTFAQSMMPTAQAPIDLGQPVLGPRSEKPVDESICVNDSFVGILDSAVPRNILRMRFDLGYHDFRPTRAEFIQSKPGVLGGPGQPLAERNLNYQELSTYAEVALMPWFSGFLETPVRWINPDFNANTYGYGNINFGFKLCTWSSDNLIATLQLRAISPTQQQPGLGTDHWTIEPGLLAAYAPFDNIELEGELRYWKPIGGTDFAGDIVRYGVGLSVFQKNPAGIWFRPVVEGVGWTVLGGKDMIVQTPDIFTVQDSAGQTIANGYLGLRFGYGSNLDFYAGYGRCFTGNTWARDFVRFEMRFIY